MRQSISLNRRAMALATVLTLTGGAGLAQQDLAASFPSKPIHIVIPFVPGGGSDSTARLLATKLTERFGWQVVVENRTGGNTVIATQQVAKSAPDGHTLLLANSTFAINPVLLPNLPYDSSKDLIPVTTVAITPFVMAVHPSVQANNLKEMLAIMRSGKPGEWNFATVGSSGIGRIAGELFAQTAGVQLQHVPYKGAAQVTQEMLAGVVKFTIDVVNTYPPHVRSGKIKALAVTGKSRIPSLPDVPTFAEQGMPEFDVSMWFGLLASGGTPRPIIDKLNAAINEVLAMPDVKQRLAAIEMQTLGSTPEGFQSYIKTESESFAKVIQSAGIKPAE
jgi:tripartite-type tricarboxylate transporter receptor subunit TctC